MFFSESDIVMEVIGVYKIKRDNFFNKSNDKRTYNSLSLRISGESVFKFGDTTLHINEKHLTFIPPNVNYVQNTKKETIIAIHFLTYNNYDKAFAVHELKNHTEIKEQFIKIYNIWSQKRYGYKYLCTSMLYDVFFKVCNESQVNNASTETAFQRINNAVVYIHQNFKKEKISISMLAKMSYMSEAQFRKIFKSIFSTSPNKYINELRLETSTQLLQSGFYNIKETAQKSGFDDVKYFSKLFKKKFSCSPKQYLHDFVNSTGIFSAKKEIVK